MDAVLTRAGIAQEPQVAEQPISSPQEFDQVEPGYNPQLKGYPLKVVSVRGQTTATRRFEPQARAFVERELATGATVTIRYQQANRQVATTACQPPARPRHTSDLAGARHSTQPTNRKPASKRYIGPGYDPQWCLSWAIKLLEQVSPWRRRDERLVHVETGEVLSVSASMVLGILLAPTADIPAVEREQLPQWIAQDSLLLDLLTGGGQLQRIG